MTTYELETLSSPSRATLTSIISSPTGGRYASLRHYAASPSGAHVPRCKILLLRGCEDIHVRPHRLELEARDLAIDGLRHAMHLVRQRRTLLHEILRAQRLVREAHVHHARRMSFRRREIDQPSLAKQKEALPANDELFDEWSHAALRASRQLFQRRDVDLDVEVPRVRDHCAVLHRREVLAAVSYTHLTL